MTSVVLTCANDVSFSAELLSMASLSVLKISWMAVPPSAQAAALLKQEVVCRWQKMCFCQPLQPWEGREKEGAFLSSFLTTNSVGPATTITSANRKFS